MSRLASFIYGFRQERMRSPKNDDWLKQPLGGQTWSAPSQFTKSEARAWLLNKSLPDNFADRVRLVLEFPCSNCDDRTCMSCVLRQEHDRCVDDCPFCCEVAK